jgi:hypothetical protein
MFDYLSTLAWWSVENVAASKRNRDAKKNVRAKNFGRQRKIAEKKYLIASIYEAK